MRTLCFAISIALLLPTFALAESTQCTAISSVPYIISKPGGYCLSRDVTSNADGGKAAITITADNVQLDLNSHSIVGPGGKTTGYGIYALGRSGLTIHNGFIRNFSTAVNISDVLVGVPPVNASGASRLHHVSHLHIDSSMVGILVIGPLSTIRDNFITNSSSIGIKGATSLGAGLTGAVNIISNQVFATVAPAGSQDAVYGIVVAGSTGSVVQGNFVSQVHGPNSSAGIYLAGEDTVVSGNRETDIQGNPVFCYAGTTYSVAKVEGNIDFVSNSYAGNLIYGCSQPTGNANNNF